MSWRFPKRSIDMAQGQDYEAFSKNRTHYSIVIYLARLTIKLYRSTTSMLIDSGFLWIQLHIETSDSTTDEKHIDLSTSLSLLERRGVYFEK